MPEGAFYMIGAIDELERAGSGRGDEEAGT